MLVFKYSSIFYFFPGVCQFETGDAYLKEFYPDAVDNMHTNFGALGGFTVSFVVFTIIAFKIRGIPNLN